jgi:hypothetical protein
VGQSGTGTSLFINLTVVGDGGYDVNFTPTAGMSETKNNNIMCNYQRVVSSTNLINILLSTPKQKRAL